MRLESKIIKNFKSFYSNKTVILSVFWVLACIWLYINNFEGQTAIVVCPSKLFYGIPCPGCGTTRATLMFLHCEISKALMFNPNCIIALLFIFGLPIVSMVSILMKRNYVNIMYIKAEKIMSNYLVTMIFIVIEACIWVHNIVNNI